MDCNCRGFFSFDRCLCGLEGYLVEKTDCNFMSYGEIKGFYKIEPEKLYDFILNNDYSGFFRFIDIRTEYFKFYMDVDLDILTHFKGLKYSDFCDYLIKTILVSLREHVHFKGNRDNKKLYEYIYCVKNNFNSGIHLYFPNIIINYEITIKLVDKIINRLNSNNPFQGLRKEHWLKIIDKAMYSNRRLNGMSMLFQGEGKYEISDKSTFPIAEFSERTIVNDKIDHLRLTCLKTSAKTINFVFKE